MSRVPAYEARKKTSEPSTRNAIIMLNENLCSSMNINFNGFQQKWQNTMPKNGTESRAHKKENTNEKLFIKYGI